MARKVSILPDLYFPDEDQELQTSSVEGEGGHGQGGGLEGGKLVDMTPEGFIPIHKLTLEDLPDPISTEDNLQFILNTSEDVVKINNNCLSDKRPDDDCFKRKKQRSLCGSGFLKLLNKNHATVTTNRHVLYNEEELYKSTFDVFYDYHLGDPDDKKKLLKRSSRSNGKVFLAKSSKDDVVHASYELTDTTDAHIRQQQRKAEKHRCFSKLLRYYSTLDTDPNMPPIACLISHPLGQPKHVSFGEMVNYDMPSRTVHHTAPSKPGSSGGRVIVFSASLLAFDIHHVGTDLENGYKYARLHFHVLSPLYASGSTEAHALIHTHHTENARKHVEVTFEEMAHKAAESLENASLVAFAPLFGAFLLQAENIYLAGLDASTLRPCKTSLTDESLTSHDLRMSVRELINKLTQAAPSFILSPSSGLGDTTDLLTLLKSQGPCYCQSIVTIMERGVQLEDGTVTECFLSPYTAAAKMSSDGDVTWPWLNGSKPDSRNEDPPKACLTRMCLELCTKSFRLVLLLLMIIKANKMIRRFCFQSGDASSTVNNDSEIKSETTSMETTQHPYKQNGEERAGKKQNPPNQTGKKLMDSSTAGSKENWRTLAVDVLSFLQLFLGSVSSGTTVMPSSTHQTPKSQHGDRENLCELFSRCLTFAEHSLQHELQIHPDTEHEGRGDSGGDVCLCGRPGLKELYCAQYSLGCFAFTPGASGSTFSFHMDAVAQIMVAKEGESHILPRACFAAILLVLQRAASEQSLPLGTAVMTDLDKMHQFPHGRHSFMLYLASEEAFLYNFCLLAKHISKCLKPWYFAFPMSVFGRPGNWPGNVTPPEVQRTAWRLIQDAIMASGFRPAVLAALEKDAERREKLIDLYVDMKQLKWQGKIQPYLFGKYLAVSERHVKDHVQFGTPFFDSTHYCVWYATFLVCPKMFASRSFMQQPKSLK